MRVHLVREPENPMDTYAVKVLTADGLSLGHIPKELLRYLSPLMDKGVVDVQGYVSESTSEAARLKLDLREIQSRTIGSLSEFSFRREPARCRKRIKRFQRPRRGSYRFATEDIWPSATTLFLKVTIMGRPLNNANGMKSRFYGYDGQKCSVEDLALQYYAGETSNSPTLDLTQIKLEACSFRCTLGDISLNAL
ncbi:hypothetical protein SELMODRAFT_432063 [Selaginella moellendorffii]|uniref:Fanconi-associated nuclease n=1 Tax=Selaginella moellendorffii TaxID=88036 RepID=D8TEV5_SELML|nr:hypothetical protein SELMODRAFT_432063 [Selaginella moellendorffii]